MTNTLGAAFDSVCSEGGAWCCLYVHCWGGLTSLQAAEMKFALLTCPEDWPGVPKHSNGPSVKKESLASEENCNMLTGNEDLSVK